MEKCENMQLVWKIVKTCSSYGKRKKCQRPYLRSAASSPAAVAAIADLGGFQEPHSDNNVCRVNSVLQS